MRRREFITAGLTLTGLAAADSCFAQTRAAAPQSAKRDRALSRFWQAVAGRQVAPCDMVFVGDSVTEGFVPWGRANSLLTNQAWRVRLQDLLRDAYQTPGAAGTAGYYAAFRMSAAPPDYPVRFTGRAANNVAGLGLRCVLLTAAEHQVTFKAPSRCSTVDIFWGGAPMTGSFSYAVNGRAMTDPVLTALTHGEEDFHSTRIGGLSGGEEIRVAHASGGPVVIDGFYAYDGDEARGLRGWDAGQTGVPATALVAEASRRWYRAFEVIQPSLVVIEIGGNDSRERSAAQVGSDVRTMIELIKARCARPPSIVLIGLWSPPWTARDPWESYHDAFRGLAAADPDAWFFDLRTLINKTGPTDTVGGLLPDAVHPGPQASAIIAKGLFDALRPAPGWRTD